MEENLYRDFNGNRSSWGKLEIYFRGSHISGLFLPIAYMFMIMLKFIAMNNLELFVSEL